MTRPSDLADRLARADSELPPQPAPAIDFVAVAARRRCRRWILGLLGIGALGGLVPLRSPPVTQRTGGGQGVATVAPIVPTSNAHRAAVQAATSLSRRLENLRVAWSSPADPHTAAARERTCRTEIRARLATIRAETALALASRSTTTQANRNNR